MEFDDVGQKRLHLSVTWVSYVNRFHSSPLASVKTRGVDSAKHKASQQPLISGTDV